MPPNTPWSFKIWHTCPTRHGHVSQEIPLFGYVDCVKVDCRVLKKKARAKKYDISSLNSGIACFDKYLGAKLS
jgi:hypothetical protein